MSTKLGIANGCANILSHREVKKSVQVIRDQAGGVAKPGKGGLGSAMVHSKVIPCQNVFMGLLARCDLGQKEGVWAIWADRSGEILALEHRVKNEISDHEKGI